MNLQTSIKRISHRMIKSFLQFFALIWRGISQIFILVQQRAGFRRSPQPQKKPSQTLDLAGQIRYWQTRWKSLRSRKHRQYHTRKERIKRLIVLSFSTFVFTIQFTGLDLLFNIKPAFAATTIAIEPITWDFVGLDSNKPETDGPNTYVVGARVCNIGTEDALNVKVKFNKDGVDNGYAYIQLQAGDTYTFDRIPADDNSAPIRATDYVFDTRANGSLEKSKYKFASTPQYCQDFYYNFEVTRTPAAWNTYQKYYIEASGSNTNYVATERPRQNYIEKLISQARNEVFYFGCDPSGGSAYTTGAVTVQVGDVFTCETRAHTSTAYPQMSFTADIPNVIFQVLKVSSTYSNPTGGINSTVYADACGWVNDPTDPRYHLSPSACSSETTFANTYSDQYPYTAPPTEGKGGVGNDIVTRYTIKVLAFPNGIPNPIRVSNVILDFSGSSYHYNADYGTAPNLINITVANPNPTDLSVTKTHTGNFSYGDNTYTLTVADNANGTSAKSPVILTDTLPAGYTFKDMNATKVGIQPLSGANAANWNCNTSGQIMTCLYDTNGDSVGENFPDGGTNTLTLNVNIANGAVPSGTTSTNFARVSLNSAQTDSNTTNNTASDPTTVLALPNLVLAKTSSPAPPTKFELGAASASYTLTATNSSLFDIAGPLTLVDNLPPGITFNSVDTVNTSAGWSCNATDATKQTVICTNSSGVVSGADTRVTLKVDVSGSVVDSDTGTQGIQVKNKAVISTGSAETSLTDNEATITNEVNKPAPDLSILKTDSNLDFIDNGTSYYFLTVTNVGGLPTSGTLTIRDTLPEIFNTSNVSQGRLVYSAVVDPATGAAPTNWTCSAVPSAGSSVNNDITCNSAAGFTLAPGQSSTLRIAVTVPNLPNGTFNPVTNTATITPITGEIITANNTSSDTTNIVNSVTGNQTNISVVKSVTTAPTGPGSNIVYRLEISNTDSNQDITRGVFEDIVPSLVSGVTASCAVVPNGSGYTGAGSCCTLSTTIDPASGGTKVSCNGSTFIGLPKRSGQNVAAVRITISGTVSKSGTIYNGASVGIDPTDTVKDNNALDNYSSVATSVPGPTLTLAKTPIPTSFLQGELVTYRLTVTNPGAPNTLNSAGFLRITDPLPSQYTYISSTSATGSSGWQCEAVGQNVTCLNGSTTLTPGQSTSVDLLLRVSGNGSSIINTATLTRPDGTTTTASNTQNIASAIPDVVITKTAANIAIAQQGSYTIRVQNIGTGKAAGPIIVRDTLPTGLSFLSGSGTGWSCTTQTSPTVDPQQVICTNYSDLAGNNTFAPDLTLNVLVGASVSGSLSNTATVNLAPDATILGETVFGNNTTTISTPVATTSDFAVVKTAVDQNTTLANNQFYQDGTAVYNITVTNNGPSAYSGTVTINENLGAITPSDPNFTYVSHGDSATWSCTNVATSGACAAGAKNLRFTKTGGLLAGESSTITLTVNVPDGVTGTFTNTAIIDAATITAANDTNTSNNSDPEIVDVLDNTTTLTLEKDDNDGESPDEPTTAQLQTKFVKGGVGKYTIVARNTGASPAKAPVTISDTLPSGLTYAGNSQTANWSCTGTIGSQNFSCIYGVWTDTDNDGDRFDVGGSLFTQQDLPVGTASGVEIRVNVLNSATTSTLSGNAYTGLTTNTASVSGSNFTTANASEQTAIVDPADLAVTKAIGALTAGGTGTYTITVTNNGPGISYPQIYLQDYLPTGLTYSGATSGTAAGDGTWTIIGYNDTANEVTYRRSTALTVGATTTISLPVNVSASAPGSVTNFIRVGGFTPEPDYDANTPGYQDPIQATCDTSFGANQPVNNCFALTSTVTGGVSTDLSITKIHGVADNDDPPSPAVNFNTNYSYTLRVANLSTTNAETVTVSDVLPTWLEYVSYSIDAGDLTIPNPYGSTPTNLNRICNYTSGTRTFSCNLLRISTAENASDPVDITLTVKSLVSGVVNNTATVASVTADTITANNTESEGVLINAGGTNTISGRVFNDVDNGGPTDQDAGETGTQNVKVNLYLDNGGVIGTYDPGDTLVATTRTDASGDYSFTTNLTGNFVLTVDTTTLPAGHQLTPTGSAVTSQSAVLPNTPSNDINNNFGHRSLALPTVDIAITKTDSADPVNVGASFDYTLTVSSDPTNSANNVVVTDTIPASLTINSVTPGNPTCTIAGQVVTCNLGAIAANSANQVITINVTSTTSGTVTNTATVTTDNPEGNTANNTDSEQTVINAPVGGGTTCYVASDGSDLLLTLDLNTLTATAAPNALGATSVEALAYNPFTNILYGANANRLGTINPSSGVFTAIGAVFGTGDGALGAVTFNDIDALALNPYTGELFGAHRRDGAGALDVLIKIDPSTGQFIPDAFGLDVDYLVIDTGTTNTNVDDITIDPFDGTLYAIANPDVFNASIPDQFVRVNLTDGSTTVIGSFGIPDVEGLTAFNNGNIYLTTGEEPAAGIANSFYSVNKISGVATQQVDLSSFGIDYEGVTCLTGAPNFISGKVFLDNGNGSGTSNDGILNGTEAGTDGVTVRLYRDVDGSSTVNAGDILLTSQVTAGGGNYSFRMAATGAFVLDIDTATLPAGQVLTSDNLEVANFGTSLGVTDENNNFGHNVGDSANLLLVKRITAVRRNGVDLGVGDRPGGQDTAVFNDYINGSDPRAADDNVANWPTDDDVYLRGATNGGEIQTGDEIEYTIYFLNNGSTAADNVTLCDVVPENMTYVPSSMSLFLDSAAPLGSPTSPDSGTFLTALTSPNSLSDSVGDGDRGAYFAPGTLPQPVNLCRRGTTNIAAAADNTTGAVVIKVVDASTTPTSIAAATAAGVPSNSYGFIRFRAVTK